MASPVTVDINYRRLLRSICVKFSLPSSRYGITLNTDERFCSHVDVEVPRCSRFMEIITCWGSPSSNASHSAYDAARVAIGKQSNELAFEVRDANMRKKKTL
uniref:Uncharacterized protein n=1 Tax=Ananas comosus var. bracteatus TaxID=296719 RepID=A0A6V7P1K7_ANACO|nr:unnamed protein product [Ananas comosus var. bracteatus]